MHPETDNTKSRTSANGSPIPCFRNDPTWACPSYASTGAEAMVVKKATADKHPTPRRAGGPLDRRMFAPKSPPGTSPLPSPRGAEGDFYPYHHVKKI